MPEVPDYMVLELRERCFRLLNSYIDYNDPMSYAKTGDYRIKLAGVSICYDGHVSDICEFGGGNAHALEVVRGYDLIYQHLYDGEDENPDAWEDEVEGVDYVHGPKGSVYDLTDSSGEQIHPDLPEVLEAIRKLMVLDDIADA